MPSNGESVSMDACRLTIDALGRFHHTGLECVFHECGGLVAQSGQMGNLVLLDVLQLLMHLAN